MCSFMVSALFSLVSALFFLVFAAAPARAQDYDVSSIPYGTLQRPGQDYTFLEREMDLMNAQLVFSKIAIARSANEDVKKFAQRVVDENMGQAQWIVGSARDLKIKIPDSLSGRFKSDSDMLRSVPPGEFDRAFLTAYMKLQHADIANLMGEADHPRGSQLEDRAKADLNLTQRRGDSARALDKKIAH